MKVFRAFQIFVSVFLLIGIFLPRECWAQSQTKKPTKSGVEGKPKSGISLKGRKPKTGLVQKPGSLKKVAFTIAPPRKPTSETGSRFLTRTEKMNSDDREREIIKEILGGNFPEFLRNFRELKISLKLKDGKVHSAIYRVLPDYLMIGSDGDYVRIPMTVLAAQFIAEKFNCVLPTSKIVDDIFTMAQIRLFPQKISTEGTPDGMKSATRNEMYGRHQRLIEEQLAKTGFKPGDLVAGHKKDVIITNFLDNHPKNVAIYGWHDFRNAGKPLQGYSYKNENTYADYSHGIRLVDKFMVVDGKEMEVSEVLKNPLLSKLVSKEGPIEDCRAVR